jgi:hypothetical protein
VVLRGSPSFLVGQVIVPDRSHEGPVTADRAVLEPVPAEAKLFSAAIVIWRLRGGGEERETQAVRLIGVTFFALAAYLAAESIHDLASQARPGQSMAGLAVTAAALLVMPGLAVAKHRTGRALGNRTLIADSAETAWCALTSAAALIGLGLNAWLGWWWPTQRQHSSSTSWQSGKASKPRNTMTERGEPSTSQPSLRSAAIIRPLGCRRKIRVTGDAPTMQHDPTAAPGAVGLAIAAMHNGSAR